MYLKTAFPFCTTDAAHGMPSAQQRKLPQISLLALIEVFSFLNEENQNAAMWCAREMSVASIRMMLAAPSNGAKSGNYSCVNNAQTTVQAAKDRPSDAKA
jgi:hypothetical protein